MTRNRINRNPKLTLEQLIDINKQHVIQASLLINHMEAAENRIRELESEMDSEQRRLGDATKNFRKADRMIKEYTYKADEDRKNAERMQDLVDKLQQQVQE